MHGSTVFCAALCLGLASAGSLPSPFDRVDSRIVGGHDASLGQIPYIASLRRLATGGHWCGSSIIRTNRVLTAAHCIENYVPADISVVVGSVYLDSTGVHHAVDRIIKHEGFSRDTMTNDIGLVRVTNAFVYNENVQPIEIGTVEVDAADAVVSGWGYTEHLGSFPTILQTLNTRTISNTECRDRHSELNRQLVYDNVICSLNVAGEGICSGDSGGPLVVGKTVVGVASWALSCARGVPDGFARVSSHNEWILQYVDA